MTDTGPNSGPLFVSSGDLVSDRRYKAAVELAARGNFAAAADVLTQTVEAAPGFATAWFALGAIRDRLGDLAGAVFRPFAGRLGGIDLSAAMIARAQVKGDYDRLVVGNLAAFLSDEIAKGAKYDLVLAADVFVYVNDLAPILLDIARLLISHGIVAFTAETHSGPGVALLPTLRFAHGESYLRDGIADAGLKLLTLARAAIRTEKGTPVDGLVVVAAADGAGARNQS